MLGGRGDLIFFISAVALYYTSHGDQRPCFARLSLYSLRLMYGVLSAVLDSSGIWRQGFGVSYLYGTSFSGPSSRREGPSFFRPC